MALVLADRVKETTTTTGTGTITLAGSSTGYRSFSTVGNGNTTYYAIVGQGTSEWEVGIGTYTSSGTTLSRDTVLSSSAGGTTKTTFSNGIKDVFVTYPANKSAYFDGTSLVFLDGSTQNTAATGFGFKNRLINGACVIDQRNNGASVTPTDNQYLIDRWSARQTTASKFSAQQNSGSVTPPAGFTNYLGMVSLSAYSVLAADIFSVRQKIEGFNVFDLGWGSANAQTVTLSFWVRSSLTGTFGGALYNSASNRSYPFSYTISAANTWELETITIAGDTTGTWLTNSSTGLEVNFGLGVGSTFSGTAGAWAASDFRSATGATSVVGTSGATFYITGVQLEKGSTATSFDYRPRGTEFALCQRYYYKITEVTSNAMGMCSSTTTARLNIVFPTTMRTAPTALEQSGTAANYNINTGGSAVNCSAVPTFLSGTVNNGAVTFTVASGLTTGNGALGRGGDYLAWSAEL